MLKNDGEGAARPPRLSLPRLQPLFILAMVWALVTPPGAVLAANLDDLFWRANTRALKFGGADLPGQITGQPEIGRPTSLAGIEQGQIDFEYCSQTPLQLKQAGVTLGRWDSETSTEQLVMPLAKPGVVSPWKLGMEHRKIRERLWYRSGDLDYQLDSTNHRQTVALAYEFPAGWTIGGAYGWGSIDAVVQGESLAAELELPPTSSSWPRFDTDAREYTLAVSRETPKHEYGFQYTWGRPRQTLQLTRKTYQYSAPLQASSHRWEGYMALHHGNETYFLTGSDSHSRSQGTILVGLVGRGDASVSRKDLTLAIGYHRTEGQHTKQLVFDWRQTQFGTFDQGYVGFLPGISAEVYALRADLKVSTFSLRYGTEHPLGRGWSWSLAVGMHYSVVQGNWRLTSSQGLGRNPRTISEYHISDGIVRMLALSPGLSYENGRFAGALVYTAGVAEANDAFRADLERKPGEGPSQQLQPRPFLTLSFRYSF